MTKIQREALIALIEGLIADRLSKVYGVPTDDLAENAKAMFHSTFTDETEPKGEHNV